MSINLIDTRILPYFHGLMSSHIDHFKKGVHVFNLTRNTTLSGQCSICAHMYIRNRKKGYSYMDFPPDVVHCTPCNHFIRIKDISYDENRLKDSLCYGTSLYHTDREINRGDHILTQYTLIREAFDVLSGRKLDLFDKKPVIVYIKMNNGLTKAIYSSGFKVKHPHVWIMKKMPKYGKIFHIDNPDPKENRNFFIHNQLIFADALMDIHPDMHIYLKFFVEISPEVIISRCEIDIHDPATTNGN